MKKTLENFKNQMLSKEQMKSVRGGEFYNCTYYFENGRSSGCGVIANSMYEATQIAESYAQNMEKEEPVVIRCRVA